MDNLLMLYQNVEKTVPPMSKSVFYGIFSGPLPHFRPLRSAGGAAGALRRKCCPDCGRSDAAASPVPGLESCTAGSADYVNAD